MKSKGFSMIELMIVIAIVGVLAGISIPLYQGFVVKAQLSQAIAELGAYKSGFEQYVAKPTALNESSIGYVVSPLTDFDATDDIVVINADGSGHLEVTIGGNAHPNLSGTVIRHERDENGNWRCVLDNAATAVWRDSYNPGGCELL